MKKLAKRGEDTYNMNEINTASVGEATARIRIAAAKGWRHSERVNSSCRTIRHDLMQFHRLAELKLERDVKTFFSSPPRSGVCGDFFISILKCRRSRKKWTRIREVTDYHCFYIRRFRLSSAIEFRLAIHAFVPPCV